MTNSSKTYSLRSAPPPSKTAKVKPPLLEIPDEFDDQLLDDVKQHSTTPAQTKQSASTSTAKSTSRSTAKSSTKSAKKDSKKTVSQGKAGKDSHSGKIVTRSRKSVTKSSVRDEWYDETIFDSKRVKHDVKVKKEAPSENSIFCVKCNETFDSVDELNEHSKKKCYTKYMYHCIDKKCTKTFSQKSNMQQHYYAAHLNKPFKCEYCDRFFTYVKTRAKHEKTMHKDKLPESVTFKYSCSQCKYDTDDKTEYTTHMDRHKKFHRYCCGNCKKGFYSQAHLTYHVSKCFEVEKNFECNRCGMRFVTVKELRVHFKSSHVDTIRGEKYYCDACICVLVTKKGYNHHCRLDSHRKNVKEMQG